MLHGILGYCPQYDCIDEGISVYNTLLYYAHISGVKEEEIERYTKSLITRIGLLPFLNTKAENLSGGNKRKLCLAMALIGRPKVIYIDEASAGVDPGSRRAMWNTIKDEGSESAVVITTHAMEEA